MSKLLSTLLLGAAAGIAAGAVIHKATERTAAGKPAIPSAVLASVGGLLPLGQHLAERVVETLKSLQEPYSDDQDQEDGGDHLHQDAGGADLATNFAPETSTTAADHVGDQGHPAGPGFAQTPA